MRMISLPFCETDLRGCRGGATAAYTYTLEKYPGGTTGRAGFPGNQASSSDKSRSF